MDQKKQQDVDAIADEIVMLAKALKSVATVGTVREIKMRDLADDCQMFQCRSCATGQQNRSV